MRNRGGEEKCLYWGGLRTTLTRPIMAVFSTPVTYECFDCPKCGCQNRVNERKGGYIIDEQRKADTDEHL